MNRLSNDTSSAAWFLLIALFLVEPLILSVRVDDSRVAATVDWPRVCSGDEPHYLVMINSLVNDGDLDLANNYASVHRGSPQAGLAFAGRPLDHHVKWYVGDRLITWYDVYTAPASDRPGAAKIPIPVLREGLPAETAPRREYSWHPAGMPLLLAPILYPLRGTRWVEPGALLCSATAIIAAMLFFRMLIAPYLSNADATWAATAVAFLGTPAWHYGGTLFCEPFLLACAVGAYALALRRRAYFGAGLLIAAGALMKPPFVLLALPLATEALFDDGRGSRGPLLRAIALALPIGASVGVVLAWNYWMHGAFFRSPIRWESGNLFTGARGLLFSWNNGLFPIAPVAVPAFAAWPVFIRERRREAFTILAGFLLYFLLMALWIAWHGGACYGPRMIVPVLPLLFVPVAFIARTKWWRSRLAKAAVASTIGLSILINAIGAFCSRQVWNHHPLDLLMSLAMPGGI